jgi:hypothetical protein
LRAALKAELKAELLGESAAWQIAPMMNRSGSNSNRLKSN